MKQFIKIFTVVEILLVLMAVSVSAEGVKASHISWTDGTQPIYELSADGTVKATVTVTNNTNDPIKYVYLLKMTVGGVQADFDAVEVSLAKGQSLPFSLTLTAPSDISDVIFEASLWDDFTSPEPVCRLGTFPSNDRTILTSFVTIDTATDVTFTETTYQKNGKNVTEYFCDQEFTLADNKKYPEVTMTALDNSTKVDIKKPENFPGRTKIQVISADGEKEDYRVDYKTSMVLVDNFVNKSGFDHDGSFIVDALKLPTGLWDDDNSVNSTGESCQTATGSLIYKGYRNPVVIMELDMPEGYDIEGVPYVCKDWLLCNASSASDLKTYYKDTKNQKPMYDIDIHVKCDLLILTQTTLPSFVDSSWTKLATKGSGGIANTSAYAWVNHGYMHGYISLSNCAVKSMNLPDGEEKFTYTMYNGNSSYSPYSLFIIPRYDVEEVLVNE